MMTSASSAAKRSTPFAQQPAVSSSSGARQAHQAGARSLLALCEPGVNGPGGARHKVVSPEQIGAREPGVLPGAWQSLISDRSMVWARLALAIKHARNALRLPQPSLEREPQIPRN